MFLLKLTRDVLQAIIDFLLAIFRVFYPAPHRSQPPAPSEADLRAADYERAKDVRAKAQDLEADVRAAKSKVFTGSIFTIDSVGVSFSHAHVSATDIAGEKYEFMLELDKNDKIHRHANWDRRFLKVFMAIEDKSERAKVFEALITAINREIVKKRKTAWAKPINEFTAEMYPTQPKRLF